MNKHNPSQSLSIGGSKGDLQFVVLGENNYVNQFFKKKTNNLKQKKFKKNVKYWKKQTFFLHDSWFCEKRADLGSCCFMSGRHM